MPSSTVAETGSPTAPGCIDTLASEHVNCGSVVVVLLVVVVVVVSALTKPAASI